MLFGDGQHSRDERTEGTLGGVWPAPAGRICAGSAEHTGLVLHLIRTQSV